MTGFIFSIVKIRGYDLFIYLRLAQFESFLTPLNTNFFSYTYPDFPYKNYSLLFSEIAGFITHFFGFSSLIIFQALVVAASFSIIFLATDEKKNFLPLFLVFLLSLFTLRYRLLFRPHNITYIFFALNLYLIYKRPSHYLFFLFVNQVLWVNTHNGFVLGVINLFLLYPRLRIENKKFFQIFIILLAGSLCSPHFYMPFLEVINPFLGETKDIFRYLKVHEWQLSDSKLYFSFYGVLIFIVFYVVIEEKKWSLLTVYLFYLVMSVRFVRFIDFFALAAFFVTVAGKSVIKPKKPIKNALLLILVCGVSVFSLRDYMFNRLIPPGFGIAGYFYPEGAVNYLKKRNIKGKVFNSYAFGAYIIYSLYPDGKPAIDGRLCYPLDFIKLYANAHEDDNAFKELIKKHNPDIFMIDFEHPKMALFVSRLKEEYAVTYFDDTAMIFLKRSKFKNIVENDGYKFLSPIYISGYADGTYNSKDVKAELKRALKESPSNRGFVILANFLLNDGFVDEAKVVLENVITSQNPAGKAEAFNNLGTIALAEGDFYTAIKMFKKALIYSSDFSVPHLNLALVYDEKGKHTMALYHYLKYVRLTEDNVSEQVSERVDVLKKLVFIFWLRVIIGVLATGGIIFILLRRPLSKR